MNKIIIILFLMATSSINIIGMQKNMPPKKERDCSELLQRSHKLIGCWFEQQGKNLIKAFKDTIDNSTIKVKKS